MYTVRQSIMFLAPHYEIDRIFGNVYSVCLKDVTENTRKQQTCNRFLSLSCSSILILHTIMVYSIMQYKDHISDDVQIAANHNNQSGLLMQRMYLVAGTIKLPHACAGVISSTTAQ